MFNRFDSYTFHAYSTCLKTELRGKQKKSAKTIFQTSQKLKPNKVPKPFSILLIKQQNIYTKKFMHFLFMQKIINGNYVYIYVDKRVLSSNLKNVKKELSTIGEAAKGENHWFSCWQELQWLLHLAGFEEEFRHCCCCCCCWHGPIGTKGRWGKLLNAKANPTSVGLSCHVNPSLNLVVFSDLHLIFGILILVDKRKKQNSHSLLSSVLRHTCSTT